MSAEWSAATVPSAPRRVRAGAWMGPMGLFSLLFGGIWAVVGGTITLVFALAGGPPWEDWILSERGVTAQARPSAVRRTNMRINRQRVHEIELRYVDQSGGSRLASVRTYDSEVVERARQGEPLLVEYDPETPGRVRLEGERVSVFGLMTLFPFLFAVIGSVILLAGVRGMLRRRRLLKHGELSRGRVTAVKGTSTTMNRRQVMEVTYEFWSTTGQIRATMRHLSPPPEGTEVAVLYDLANPGRSILAEPGAFR